MNCAVAGESVAGRGCHSQRTRGKQLDDSAFAGTPTPRSAELTAAGIRWKEEFGALRDIVVQLAELRGEGAWKEMRYDLEVACAELRVAENKLVEVSLPPRLWAVSSPRRRRGL